MCGLKPPGVFFFHILEHVLVMGRIIGLKKCDVSVGLKTPSVDPIPTDPAFIGVPK